MQEIKNYTWTLVLLLSFVSCSDENVKVVHQHYYDLSAFFKQEASALYRSRMAMEKQIIKDGLSEKKKFINVNWLSELKPFIDCDINKPAWVNSYQTDTIHLSADSMKVVFKAIETQLPIRKIELTLYKQKVCNVQINKECDNFYYQSSDLYVYQSTKGFEISGSQKVRLLDKTSYRINATFMH